MSTTVQIAEATTRELAALAAETRLAVLPVGSTEQHGPHAPLGTDAVAAEAVAEAGADRHGEPVAVAPTVPVGVSEEHRRFAGSLWVTPDTFRAYVRETVASLASHGFDRVVVVNGHGGNVAAIAEVGRRLTRDGVAHTVPFTWFETVGESAPPMGHGGARETALLRAVRPDLVREDLVTEAAADAADRWGEWAAGTNLAVDVDEFSENGVVGDPRAGDEAAGEAMLETAGAALASLLAALGDRDRGEDDDGRASSSTGD